MAPDDYKYDLVLLHAPAVYDFRKTSIMFGPISDVVPSSSIFEIYPIGFGSIARHLKNKGMRVRILNLAVKMLLAPELDVEKLLGTIKSRVFGIDLHWLCHAHGSVEVAKLVKKIHPDSKIVFGGISATYFHKELMTYPFIDYCFRGDSTEPLMEMLINTLKNGGDFGQISNLCWRNKQGETVYNEFNYIPGTLENIQIDYKNIFFSALRDLDLSGYLPFTSWVDYPVTAIVLSRGCNYNCNVCGGSNDFYREHCGRQKAVYRTPKNICEEIKNLAHFINGPLLLIGDLFLNGKDYSYELLEEFKKMKISNQIIFEVSLPPTREELVHISEAIPRFNILLSPESHDERVRSSFGRHFTNRETEDMIETAVELGVGRIDLFFMIGLPEQTRESVMETVEYCDYLLGKFAKSKKLSVYISPLSPFLDPGSRVFENPEAHGYKLFYRTLEEHRRALLQPSWKYILNYETRWLSRDDIVDCSYRAALGMNRIKLKHDLLNPKEAKKQEEKILEAQAFSREIDKVLAIRDETEKNRRLQGMKRQMDKYSRSTTCNMKDLEWSIMIFNVRAPKFLRVFFFYIWSGLSRVFG
ncbi:MAG: TIGR04190 family B12-binding domain/radical SAM domain protein [bacterium]